jgi:SAM-dependent methyltransferase
MATTTPITSNWQKYFVNPDEGLGTTYERFVLHNYFSRFKARYDVRTIVEAPSFGMTGVSGINSLWWAQQGVEVTVVDQCLERMESIQKVWEQTGLKMNLVFQSPDSSVLPFADRSFDMAWNFAALWYASDGEAYLKELARVAKRALFICVPNSHNICWVTRPDDASDVNMDYINPDWIISSLVPYGWRLVERGFLDVPPWPHIELRKEEMLRRVGLSRIARAMEAKNAGVCIVDYFTGRLPAMEGQVLKYSFLEQSPGWLKKYWAHHRFALFEKTA